MTAAPAPRLSEMHGDMYDGLVLVTRLSEPPMPVFVVPVDPYIRTREEYARWVPVAGQEVIVYQTDGPPRRTETSKGMFHHHYRAVGRKVLGTDQEIQ